MDSPLVTWIFLGVAFGMLAVSIAALVDVLRSQFRSRKDKLRWAAVIILGGIVGAVLYFAIGTRYKRHELS